jgi:hypothetical protein
MLEPKKCIHVNKLHMANYVFGFIQSLWFQIAHMCVCVCVCNLNVISLKHEEAY